MPSSVRSERVSEDPQLTRGHGASRLTFLLAAGLIVGWGLFQIVHLSFNGPWMDEAVYTMGGLEHEWYKWIGGLIYPPVAGLGAWVSRSLGFEPILGARFMSVLFGMGTSILIYRMARLLAPFLTEDPGVADCLPPMAVLLFCLSGSLLFIGRCAVYDGMCYFFFVLSLYSLCLGVLGKNRSPLFVAALALIASFATKYIVAIYGMFPLPIMLLVAMRSLDKRKRTNGILGSSVSRDEGAGRILRHFVFPVVLLGGAFLVVFWAFVQEGQNQVLRGVLPFGFRGGALEILVTSLKVLLPALPLAALGVLMTHNRPLAAQLVAFAAVPVIYHLVFGHVASIGKVLALSYLPGLLLLGAIPMAWLAARAIHPGRRRRLALGLLAVLVASTSFHAGRFLHQHQGWRDTRRSFAAMWSFVRPTDKVLSYHIKYTAALMLRLPLSQVDERWDRNHLELVRQGSYDSILLTGEQRRSDVAQENGESSDQFVVLKEALRSGRYEIAFWELPNLPDNPIYYGKADTAATRKLNQEPTPEELEFARTDPLVRAYFDKTNASPSPRDIIQGVFVLRKRQPPYRST